MKRLITFALVLVMALSLAAPALAFTDVAGVDADAEKPQLAIKLVDLSEGFVTVNFNAPPTNRGYVTNEVVCAVVSMQVAKDYEFGTYDVLEFSGVNVSLWQDENFYAQGSAVSTGGGTGTLRYMSSNVNGLLDTFFSYADNMATDNWIQADKLSNLDANNGSAQTYHFAIFGRVLGENAKMTATLKGTGTLNNAYFTSDRILANASFTTPASLKDGDFAVYYYDPNVTGGDITLSGTGLGMASPAAIASSGNVTSKIQLNSNEAFYYVEATAKIGLVPANTALFVIVTDKNFNTKRMYVYSPATHVSWFEVKEVSYGGTKIPAWDNIQVVFEAADNATGVKGPSTEAVAANLANTVNTFVAEEFGLDIRKMGNKLKPEWWLNNETQTVEVAIEPWYAEVTVPPEIEIDIPKTGDAMSAVGFVLIALAGLAVVAVRKVKA